jgi:hypothetical protein
MNDFGIIWMKFGNEFWLILFQEYISPKLFAVQYSILYTWLSLVLSPVSSSADDVVLLVSLSTTGQWSPVVSPVSSSPNSLLLYLQYRLLLTILCCTSSILVHWWSSVVLPVSSFTDSPLLYLQYPYAAEVLCCPLLYLHAVSSSAYGPLSYLQYPLQLRSSVVVLC